MKTILKYKITSKLRSDMYTARYELMEVKDNLLKTTEIDKEDALSLINEFDMKITTKNTHGIIWEQEKGFLKSFIDNHELKFDE